MKIADKYSHLNGEEYLIVHHSDLYKEIKEVISAIDAEEVKTKVSQEKTMAGQKLFSPKQLNKAFEMGLNQRNWLESRYNYYITLNRTLMEKSILMPTAEQKKFLEENGESKPIYSYNQTDFVKDKIAVEV